MSDAPFEPVPVGTPLPHRKVIRSWLIPLTGRTTLGPLLRLLLDLAIWVGLLAAVVVAPSWPLKLLAGLVAGFWIGRLFIIGHDACHQSYTPHRRLNAWLGRVAFLPSLTPYSLWDVGHNVVHHGYTNLHGVDFVWQPFTPAQWAALPRWRRALERVYRSGWAPGLYYAVEIWWRKLWFPTRAHMPTRRAVFTRDSWLVTAFGAAWVGALAWAAQATGQSTALLVALGFGVPFAFWCSMIGFVVYVHHTHERVVWHADKVAWAAAAPFVSTTVHLTFRWRWGALMHHIMEHTAHHVDMSIPLYRLRDAQAKLETLLPGRIVVQPFSWRWYFTTARTCQLFDLSTQRWQRFA